jgi:hypothetical protein
MEDTLPEAVARAERILRGQHLDPGEAEEILEQVKKESQKRRYTSYCKETKKEPEHGSDNEPA